MNKNLYVVPVWEDDDEKPPSKEQEVDGTMGDDGGRRRRFSFIYLSSVCLYRNNIRTKWLIPEILGTTRDSNIL